MTDNTQELDEYHTREVPGVISDRLARMIASRWHSGQGSSFYSFATCGAIDKDGLAAEMIQNILEVDTDDYDANNELEALSLYFSETPSRGPVEDWHGTTRWEAGDAER